MELEGFENWNKENESYIPLLENTIKEERKKAWIACLKFNLDNPPDRFCHWDENIREELGDNDN